MINVEVIK